MPPSDDATDPARSNRSASPLSVGPVLFFRGCSDDRLHLTALIVRPDSEDCPPLTVEQGPVTAEALQRCDGVVVYRHEFSLPAASGGTYYVADEPFEVAGMTEGDLRIAYLSCNGQEQGDRQRSLAERNTMWQRLARQHQTQPLNLLLQGGDQLYADEMLNVHPAVRAWADGDRPEPLDAQQAEDLRTLLRSYLLKSYLRLYSQPAPSRLLARVPSLCMWDDHDICDGWGSLPVERLESPIGREVFEAAREFFLLFQLGAAADRLPPICLDPTGKTLSWSAQLPGAFILAPDLRSERQPDRVLGPSGWAAIEQCLDHLSQPTPPPPESDHGTPGQKPSPPRVLILSSVPVLGPRLSWVEAVLHFVPGAQKYEDDLRDQWQSRAHRDEWRRFLQKLLEVHQDTEWPVTILSGEVHLATRCTMAARNRPLHQLIASGITHPPPPAWYARLLGTLARLGEAPLPAHPIRLHPLPGRRSIYTAQRNYLMLQRRDGHWSAWWELEHDGPTPPLDFD